ncbi:MAG: D-alanine--D-alanine ligase [Gammaproteobacteria bacterium]|nr:D-alanine--D-alanine ligase [Gammaproteobacteria bacterium]
MSGTEAETAKTGRRHSPHVAEGMPPLDLGGRPVSFFEFWPTWLMYLPVAIQCLLLGLRHRAISLPLIANPAVPLSGMVGTPKSAILKLAGPAANEHILPWIVIHSMSKQANPPNAKRADDGERKGPGASREGPAHHREAGAESEAKPNPTSRPVGATNNPLPERVASAIAQAGLEFPLVGKPDIGCRGAGVKLLRDREALEAYLEQFPPGAAVMLQKLADFEAEAGVFYVRDPETEQGEITSLTLKYTPYVVGDGKRSLAELVAADPRAGGLARLYRERNASHWHEVIPDGHPHRLVFSASHCRGAVFRDGGHLITAELTAALDRIFDDIPGFYYGRLDVKFRDVDSLRAGRGLQIVEINGASSESIHIWDRRTGLLDAVKTLLRQYQTLFRLGLANRKRGSEPPGLWPLYKAWRHELQLVKQYPAND